MDKREEEGGSKKKSEREGTCRLSEIADSLNYHVGRLSDLNYLYLTNQIAKFH